MRISFSCEHRENAEAGICAGPPGSPSAQKLNNSRGCSLMRRDIAEQFPGDICGESLGMPPPSPRRTHFTSSSRPGRCCRQGPPKGEIKKGAVVSLQERWTPVFSLFFCLCHTCRKRGREGKNINVEEKKERKKSPSACCGVPALHQ